MMKRVLEPEIMDDAAQVAAYARADFSSSNRWFIDQLTGSFFPYLQNVVDLGCGPADIPVQLAKAKSDIRITAVDGSREMLDHARRVVDDAEVRAQVSLFHGYVPQLSLKERSFDAVLSKDFLHHLPDPTALWAEAARLGRRGAAVIVMDLLRPDSEDEARDVVERVAKNEDPILKEDFFRSLCAAFTLDEIKEQIAGSGLEALQVTDRHCLIRGFIG